jgi:hypothetical protein
LRRKINDPVRMHKFDAGSVRAHPYAPAWCKCGSMHQLEAGCTICASLAN